MNENPVGYRISGPSLLINLYCSVCSQRFWRWGGRAPEANQSYQANLSHFIRIYLYNFYLVKQYNLWNYILFMSCCKIWFSRSLIRTFFFLFIGIPHASYWFWYANFVYSRFSIKFDEITMNADGNLPDFAE